MTFENKIISRLIGFAFFFILCALCASTLLLETNEYSFYENRNLTPMPEYEIDKVMSGEYFTGVEKYLSDHSAGRKALVKINTALELAAGKVVVNEVVLTDDALLPYNDFEASPNSEDIKTLAAVEATNLVRHKETAQSYGGRFCYVAIPCQYVCLSDKYPWYLENREAYTEESSRTFFETLESVDVDYIDMLSVYNGFSDEKKAQFTSKIDNHFSILGAYETYLCMIDKINGDWNGSLDVLREGDFDVVEIPNPYIGSRNRKLFDLRTSGEKLLAIYPKNEIPFRRYNSDVEGAPILYSLPDDPFSQITYTMYMNGDMPRTTIDTERPELPSILIYGDSFTNAVECVAWYSFDRMYSVDFRHYDEKTVDEIILEYKPDYVFCLRDYEALLNLSANGQ